MDGRAFNRRPDLPSYYGAVLFNKTPTTLTLKEYQTAKTFLTQIVKEYWEKIPPKERKKKLPQILRETVLNEVYRRYPNAPKSYTTFWRLVKNAPRNQ